MTSSRARNYQRRGGAHTDGKADVYQAITDRMVAALDGGKVPWRQPWTSSGRPRSMTTGQTYRGVNTLLLGLTSMERGYRSPWWGTAHQINEEGGHIRKGQNAQNGCGATWITLWKTYEPRNAEPNPETDEVKQYVVARLIPVFNAEQCEGLAEKFYPKPGDAQVAAEPESALAAYQATGKAAEILHDVHGEAYYSPATDKVHVPPAGEHYSTAEYYSTLWHEVGHSTGHPARLDRRNGVSLYEARTPHDYGHEELVAEITAGMLCAETGVATDTSMDNSAAYVRSWADKIKADKKLVVQAAAAAQKAADLVMEPTRQAEREADPADDYKITGGHITDPVGSRMDRVTGAFYPAGSQPEASSQDVEPGARASPAQAEPDAGR